MKRLGVVTPSHDGVRSYYNKDTKRLLTFGFSGSRVAPSTDGLHGMTD